MLVYFNGLLSLSEVLSVIHHQSVLLKESLDVLSINADGIYIDGTFGRGGHSREILNRLSSKGRLFAVDKDPEAVIFARKEFFSDKRFQIFHCSFAELKSYMRQFDLLNKVDGMLFDLGISSVQLDSSERGFSFMRNGSLDMRMNPTVGIDAATWITSVKESILAKVLKEFGDERFSKRIARAVVKARKLSPIKTTKRLAEIIREANPRWERRIHPATRSFLAIRIFINQELAELKTVLSDSLDILKVGGRLSVISFNSSEDRIVKRFMKDKSRGRSLGLPNQFLFIDQNPQLKLIGKLIRPSKSEINNNSRARSAILRVCSKLSS